jgi:hypothetical protein
MMSERTLLREPFERKDVVRRFHFLLVLIILNWQVPFHRTTLLRSLWLDDSINSQLATLNLVSIEIPKGYTN